MRKSNLQLEGQVFGKLTVISKGTKPTYWRCQCACGSPVKEVRAGHLRSGATSSCGCVRAVHLQTNTPTYRSWKAMKARCKDRRQLAYGGRGISYDPRWEKFPAFYRDMGDRPAFCTLDRLNPLAGYYKENCQWGSLEEQARNKRNVEFIVYDPEDAYVPGTHPEWARFLSARTGKAWTPKILRLFLKFLSLDQIINATHPQQLKRAQLVAAAKEADYQKRLRDNAETFEMMKGMAVEAYAQMGQPMTDDEIARLKNLLAERELREALEAEGWP